MFSQLIKSTLKTKTPSMSIALYSLSSSLHLELEDEVKNEAFILGIEQELGEKFDWKGDDFSTFGTHDADVIYIRTGGTEGLFKRLGISGKVNLLTSGKSNSLAASMEILAWLKSRGQDGRILHGNASDLARIILDEAHNADVKSPAGSPVSSFIKPMPAIDLGGIRLGVIGRPSDWLVASGVDYSKVREKLNAELVDIEMDELVREIKTFDGDLRSFEGSAAIYDALKRIVAKYALQGLTLRCFDLLDTVHNTGCLALARLNSEGIASSCEGDIPALLTMAWLQKTVGYPGFQCNLSRIDGDRLLFAHCTVPLCMTDSYTYRTHFESGIGTAIKGELPCRDVRICKFAPDLESMVEIPGRIVLNLSEPALSRTQIVVEAPGAADYMLHSPLANHHIITFA